MYNKLARSAKAKINRVKGKYGIDLTGEITVPKLESFKSRSEFNAFKDQVKSFTNRNNTKYQFVENKYGVVASKREINKIKRDTKQAQRVAKKLAKEAVNKPFVAGGKVRGTVGQRMLQMGKPETAGITIPRDFDFFKIRTRKQLMEKAKNMRERSDVEFFDKRMELMKDNYIKSLESTYNSDAHELAKVIEQMSPKDFYEMYISFDSEMEIKQVYIDFALGVESDPFVGKILANIELYQSGLYKDLRGF